MFIWSLLLLPLASGARIQYADQRRRQVEDANRHEDDHDRRRVVDHKRHKLDDESGEELDDHSRRQLDLVDLDYSSRDYRDEDEFPNFENQGGRQQLQKKDEFKFRPLEFMMMNALGWVGWGALAMTFGRKKRDTASQQAEDQFASQHALEHILKRTWRTV